MQRKPESALIAFSPGRSQVLTILVADDHHTSRHLLVEMLFEEFPMAQIYEAGNGNEVLDNLKLHSVDLLLLDINMPQRSGLEILPDVRSLFPHTRVIVISVHPEDLYATIALEAGAHAFLDKDKVPEKLISTVESVLRTSGTDKRGTDCSQLPAESPGVPSL